MTFVNALTHILQILVQIYPKAFRAQQNHFIMYFFLDHSLFFTPTNQFEMEKIINNLKVTSPGYDDIHPKIIKQISMIIAMPLSHIINCSLMSGIVPSKLKIAKVIPIFKNGHREDMYNYSIALFLKGL